MIKMINGAAVRVIAAICNCCLLTADAHSQTKVGIIAGLSGENAAYGRAYRLGVEIAQSKFP